MADGIVCKNCGRQETEHDLVNPELSEKNSLEKVEDSRNTKAGYKKSLETCSRYEPED